MTTVVNKTKDKYDIYIGRGTPWGNPYKMYKEEDRDKVCDLHRQNLLGSTELMSKLWTLRGKTLGCHCKPLRCHGDTLAELADSCIMEFNGNNRFLSNFFGSPINYRGIEYATVEHFFQAMKSEDPAHRVKVAMARTPSDAKYLGRSVKLRPDWESVKNNVMLYGLVLKFKDEWLKKKLLETGTAPLVEGNTWGDNYWGVDLNKMIGTNNLGKLLMEVRLKIGG